MKKETPEYWLDGKGRDKINTVLKNRTYIDAGVLAREAGIDSQTAEQILIDLKKGGIITTSNGMLRLLPGIYRVKNR